MAERDYLVALSMVAGIGPARTRRLLAAFGTAAAAWAADERALRAAGLETKVVAALQQRRQTLRPEELPVRLARAGAQVVTADEAAFPPLLRELPGAPLVLFVRGALPSPDRPAVALVGTRRPSADGREMARRLARELSAAGLTIVSGLARGIDAAAHLACLEAGGPTLAVLGSGVDVIYPAEHRELASRIAGQGALISEYGLGEPPDAPNFPARNRIIAGLVRAVVVVEAGARSGALITAGFAADAGREVFAVPGSVPSGTADGCHALIRDGALLVTSAAEVLEGLALSAPGPVVPRTVPLPLGDDPVEQAILAGLAGEARHIDELARASGLPMATLGATLTLLELKGLIRQARPLHYCRC